ncbi:hypothetical protein EVAR_3576_1 [Eumeta japonica]|uniref:Uncharacterized protein n=1 Tax=Eumeta variegata TaxID=151549 RepID=A0A4C1SVM4_EUMVA|nr:hypothetical protein EVAR_3576_1 [Eumeta japonica]
MAREVQSGQHLKEPWVARKLHSTVIGYSRAKSACIPWMRPELARSALNPHYGDITQCGGQTTSFHGFACQRSANIF